MLINSNIINLKWRIKHDSTHKKETNKEISQLILTIITRAMDIRQNHLAAINNIVLLGPQLIMLKTIRNPVQPVDKIRVNFVKIT
jgi:hypothetical protein